MDFCIRDDDTSFFTQPDDLELAYGHIKDKGPVSLAIVPFHRAGTSKGVPERFRRQWTVHPLHANESLVAYLRDEIANGRFEAMLHGYHHDKADLTHEFANGSDLAQKILDGKKYLEDLLGTRISVFVPPHNDIRRPGLRGIEEADLHLGGITGVRRGWPLMSLSTWTTWVQLKRWHHGGGRGVPWIVNVGRHREIPGVPVTPLSRQADNEMLFEETLAVSGVLCAATHYWELQSQNSDPDELSVGEQLQWLVDRALDNPRVVWRSVGETAVTGASLNG